MSTNGHPEGSDTPSPENVRNHIEGHSLTREQMNTLTAVLEENVDKQEEILKKQKETHSKIDQNTTDNSATAAAIAEALLRKSTPSGKESALPQARTDQFIRFVKSSALGGIILALLFGSLYVQNAISASIAGPIIAILVLITAGFIGTWYDLST